MLAKHSTSLPFSPVPSTTKHLRYPCNQHPSRGLCIKATGKSHLVPAPTGGLRSTNSPLTWVTQRPGAIDEANVSREAGSEDAVGQRDQPAAPFVTPVLVAMAEPRVEGEPGKQAAGDSQGQGEQHPDTGTEAQNASEGLTFNINTTLWSISPAAIPALHVQGCFLMVLFAPNNFIFFSAEELQSLWRKAHTKE